MQARRASEGDDRHGLATEDAKIQGDPLAGASGLYFGFLELPDLP